MNSGDIALAFERIYELYPNKEKKASAFKAFKLLITQAGNDADQKKEAKRVLLATKIYAYTECDSDFHYQLGNFIRDDHWLDVLAIHPDLDSVLKEMAEIKQEADQLIEAWNRACFTHWAKIARPKSIAGVVCECLKDTYARKNWQQALDLAKKIFNKSGDSNIKVPNLVWFIKSVDKIIDGFYGQPYEPPKEIEIKKITKQQRQQLNEDFREVFGRSNAAAWSDSKSSNEEGIKRKKIKKKQT